MIPRPSSGISPGPSDRRIAIGICTLLVVFVFAVFGQTIRHEFVNFDDEEYFTSNPHVTSGLGWHNFMWAFQIGYAANWHPLTWLSLMLDVKMFGPGPAGQHLTNVLLHAANTVLLFLLLRRLTMTLWPGAFVAALFAVHPLHVESVAWAAERKDMLSGLFFMLTLLAYTRYAETSPRRGVFYCLSLIFFALGLMSKPMLVTMPFVLLLLDYWPLNRWQSSSSRQPASIQYLIIEKIPFLLLSIASCAITILAQKQAITPGIELSSGWRIGNAIVAYATYLEQMVCPVGLAVFYPHLENKLPLWQIALSFIILFSVTAGVLVWRQKRPYLLMGWLWYLGMLVPVIGLLQVGGQSHADRYTYLPLIGIFIMITWLANEIVSHWQIRRVTIGLASFVVLGALATAAAIQTTYWRNSEALWNHTLACTTENYVAYSDLADVMAKEGRLAEAMQGFQQAIDIHPSYAEAHNNLGIVLARQGKIPEAMEEYHTALDINPRYVDPYVNLGNILASEGKNRDAIEQYQIALKLNPYTGEAQDGWGAVMLTDGQPGEALKHFQAAIAQIPDSPEALLNMGAALATDGQTSEALRYFNKALSLEPNNAKAHFNLANLLASQGQSDDAIKQYQRALELSPTFSHARYQYALVLQSLGRFKEAQEQFQTILEQDPQNAPAMNNLAWLLACCPDDTVRDGKQAVQLAEKAEQLSSGRSPEILDTLSAAYAEAGNFSKAIETVKNAMILATAQKRDSMASSLQTRLMLYQVKLPYRDTRLASAAAPAKP